MKNAITLFVFSLVILIIFIPSYTKLEELRQRNFDLKRKMLELEAKHEELLREKRRLEYDPEYLEHVAREKMGLGREGEVIYRMMPANAVVEEKE